MGSDSNGTGQLATYELHVTVADRPTDRRRWNGGPMPSEEADRALHDAVAAFVDALSGQGFAVVRTSYGVRAVEADRV